jgi:hypothetical protein
MNGSKAFLKIGARRGSFKNIKHAVQWTFWSVYYFCTIHEPQERHFGSLDASRPDNVLTPLILPIEAQHTNLGIVM